MQTACGRLWLSVAVCGRLWPSVAICGRLWLWPSAAVQSRHTWQACTHTLHVNMRSGCIHIHACECLHAHIHIQYRGGVIARYIELQQQVHFCPLHACIVRLRACMVQAHICTVCMRAQYAYTHRAHACMQAVHACMMSMQAYCERWAAIVSTSR